MTPLLIANRYRVIRELGRGGMGVVYVVEHIHTGDHLALKLLLGNAAKNPEAVERFKREARASARIKSEHVVRVVDADVAPELEGAPFLVMELLNGVDLQKQLELRGRLPAEHVVRYLTQVARALDKSHQIGIVHRDLKPENLFVHHREDGSTILKILDFGISKLVGGDGNDIAGAGMTKTGAIMGTPLYMSPEQARGRTSEISGATDVWAVGLIAMQLLSGEIYWKANTVAELMSQILSEPFYPPSQRWTSFGPAVDAWFARSCAREPAQRFATVGEQVVALEFALTGVARQRDPLAGNDPSAVPLAIAATVSAPVLVGAHTTTSPIARTGATGGAPRRAGIAAGLISACVLAGGVVFALSGRGSRPEAALQNLDTRATASTRASVDSAAPDDADALSHPSPPPAGPPMVTAPASATAPPASAHRGPGASPNVPHAVKASSQSLPPPVPPPQAAQPQARPTATTFNPSML